ncbi:MAG: RICIN domain-containing protein [Bacteroidales bacterium]|jgi:hypothetical protein|nr:RICIN domain-containing protein [Bacteroidales bacterium]
MNKMTKLKVIVLLQTMFSLLAVKAQLEDYGVYTIKSVSSENYLQIAGDTLYNEKYKDNALVVQHTADYEGTEFHKYQRWHIIYVNTENGLKYYKIRSAMSGKFLDVPSGALAAGIPLQQNAETLLPESHMLWRISEVSSGKFKITNKNSGLALTTKNSPNEENAPITQELAQEVNLQLWEINQRDLCSYRDDQVTRFFERNRKNFGSSAFDQGSSIPLSNGKVLWVTQDAWDGSELRGPKNLFYSHWYFKYGNSMFLQPNVSDWSANNAPNITRESSSQNRPLQICNIQPGQSFAWPSNGVEIEGKVYVQCGEGNGLELKNQTLYELSPKTEGSTVWNSVRHVVPGLSDYITVNYSSGVVKSDDGFVYVFGSRGIGFGSLTQIYVARYPQSDPLNSWTFWDGASWIATPPMNEAEYKKAMVFEGQGASAAVAYVNGKYVLITLDQGFWATNERYCRGAVADSPTSGFGKSKKLYAICEYIYGTQVRYYSPNIHPQYDNGNDELLFTYSVNYSTNNDQDYTVNSNNQKVVNGVQVTDGDYIDPYFYRVKGVRVPYSLLGIPATIPSAVKDVKEDGLTLYPNPANELITIRSNSSVDGAKYKIYNSQGCLLAIGEIQENKINIQSLLGGIYTIVINKEKEAISETFIKAS